MKSLTIIESGRVSGGAGEGSCLSGAAAALAIPLAPTVVGGVLVALGALGAAISCAQGQSGGTGGDGTTTIDGVDCSQINYASY